MGGEVVPDNVQSLRGSSRGAVQHRDLSLHRLQSLSLFSLGDGPGDLLHLLDFQQHLLHNLT